MTAMETHPRDDLIRMVTTAPASIELRADAEGDGNTLVGYPITFNQWTEISGWEGNFLERIAPGATNKTIGERGGQVKVLFNHGMDPTIGDKPLGKPSVMLADERGVWTETPFAKTSYNEDLRELIRIGAIDGMSFRFSVVREEWEDTPDPDDHNPRGLPQRTINELKLYEFGPVTFPAYEATTAGVRARPAFEAWRQAHQTPTLVSSTEASDVLAASLDAGAFRRSEVSVEEIIPADSEAAPEGTSEEATDTPPTLAPAGDDKRSRYTRLADSMDRTVAVALRNI